MSRPVKGYTVHRKIKSAKKSVAHLEILVKGTTDETLKTKYKERIDFWNVYILKMTPDPKAKK